MTDARGSNSDANSTIGAREWIECRDCGMLQLLPAPAPGHRSLCCRCRRSFGLHRQGFHPALALALTAAILFVLTQSFPLIGIDIDGLNQSARIGSGIVGLFEGGLSPVAALVLAVGIAAPLARIAANIYVLANIALRRRPKHLATIFRLSEQSRPWAMLDVLLLGAIVTIAKLQDLASIDIGVGFWSLGLLVLTLAMLDSLLDRRAVWNELHPIAVPSQPEPATSLSCQTCGLIHIEMPPGKRCLRCAARLSRRKPDSVTRSWALVATGFLLYIPANAYPALTVVSFGRSTSATILGGVIQLVNGSDWPLALLIFTASVAVPVLKLVGLTTLLLSIRFRLDRYLIDRTRLYRIIEFIGRWSTVDIFVAALLTALVTLGQIATIEPGPGILAFGAVVVTTMFAAESFDPRLMWDATEVRRV
jgi:paraquat-inducible protein A